MARFAVARSGALIVVLAGWLWGPPAWAQAEEPETIDSTVCVSCHETSSRKTNIADDISHSIYDGLVCLNCHVDRDTVPHKPAADRLTPGSEGCRTCHEQQSTDYQRHGRAVLGKSEDLPRCSSCHGGHDVLPSSLQLSKTHPSNLPATCGACHEDVKLTASYHILIATRVKIYSTSVHGRATKGGVFMAATCNDCHSTGGTAHRILPPGRHALHDQPLQHPEHLRPVPRGGRPGLLGRGPRAAHGERRSGCADLHAVPRRARNPAGRRPALAREPLPVGGGDLRPLPRVGGPEREVRPADRTVEVLRRFLPRTEEQGGRQARGQLRLVPRGTPGPAGERSHVFDQPAEPAEDLRRLPPEHHRQPRDDADPCHRHRAVHRLAARFSR